MNISNARAIGHEGWYDVTVTPPAAAPFDYTVSPDDPAPMAVAIREAMAANPIPIAPYVPPPEPVYRRIVMRRVIVDRLAAAGLLEAAMAALDQAGTYTRERWYALRDGPFVDDPDTLALMAAIGADPDVILAPHEEDMLVPVEPEPA